MAVLSSYIIINFVHTASVPSFEQLNPKIKISGKKKAEVDCERKTSKTLHFGKPCHSLCDIQ